MKTIAKLITCSLILFALLACSSSENKAQQRFNEIDRQVKTGQTSDAEENYQQLISDYPATKGAIQAQEQLELLAIKRQKEELQQAFEAIKSIPRVIEGYKSFYQRWPKSIKELDDGEFFFDSSYLLETIPSGYTAYLALTGDTSGFKLWALPAESDSIYRLAENGKKVIRGQKQALLTNIKNNYQVETDQGALIVLLPTAVIL